MAGGGARRLAGGAGRQWCVWPGARPQGFIWPRRAMTPSAALPRQDRWRGRPCPVSGQRSWSPPRQPTGAAEAFGRAREIGTAKSVSFKKKSEMLDLKLVFKKC